MTDRKNLPVETARACMIAAIPGPTAPEPVRLDRRAVGRVLAEPIRAVRDQPPFDVSAMDGYAVRLGDAANRFQVIGESAAGRSFKGALKAGEALRIFTGAETPLGCAVVMQERALREGDQVSFLDGMPYQRVNVRDRAGDFAAGDILLRVGVPLDAWRLALAAAAGRAEVMVHARPRVAILSTGEEIVPTGTPNIQPEQIFDSNGPTLSTLVELWGGRSIQLGSAGDDEAAISGALSAVSAELILTVGGASVGDYDLVKPALTRLGLTLDVESIKPRPGKPTWFGRLGDGRCVLGLPGNPASAMVAAELFLHPLLAAWQGGDPSLPLGRGRLTTALAATGPHEHWLRARLERDAEGSLHVSAFSDQDSSLVSVFADADALLRRPADSAAAVVGEVVEVLPLDRL